MKLIWLAFLVGTVCVGQQLGPKSNAVPFGVDVCDEGHHIEHIPASKAKNGAPLPAQDRCVRDDAPLKCAQYEHVERPVSKCPDNQPVGCVLLPEPPVCAPDLHVVTEKEWQELLARLKVLERTAMICAKQADGSFTCESVEYRESHPKIDVDVKQ